MKPGGTVTFTYEREVPDSDEVEELEVTAKINDFHPAVWRLRNGDPGYPAEGGDVEELEVRLPSGEELKPDDELYEYLCQLAIDEWEEVS